MSSRTQILKANLRLMLGHVPGRAARGTVLRASNSDGYQIEELMLQTSETSMPATLTRPDRPGRHPCVLYCHARSDPALGRHELLQGSPYLQDPAYGPALARLGIAALCVDMPGFGSRRAEGSEASLAEECAGQGKSLFAVMLADLSAALGYLRSRDDIHAHRLFTLGFSMGAAHAFWLAALEDDIIGTAHMCILADMRPMIESGAKDLLGPGVAVPGLLKLGEMGDVAGLIAPSPQLVCHGAKDPLTPKAARESALARLRNAYRPFEQSDRPPLLETVIDPDADHRESAMMRVAVLDFLARNAAAPVAFAGQDRPPG